MASANLIITRILMILPSVSLGFLLGPSISCPVIDITGEKNRCFVTRKQCTPTGWACRFYIFTDPYSTKNKSYKESSQRAANLSKKENLVRQTYPIAQPIGVYIESETKRLQMKGVYIPGRSGRRAF